ncbi:hypothetical protein JYU34_019044 [Plutella xylostella]|uniref:Secreted protein n=1 Tax=Plutella xylostella TaxID=51655 RepID=A0ABQ7Q0G3_PLUXY|nr:hypothetical protein JYU34_019044 [Plutella xylostella]
MRTPSFCVLLMPCRRRPTSVSIRRSTRSTTTLSAASLSRVGRCGSAVSGDTTPRATGVAPPTPRAVR